MLALSTSPYLASWFTEIFTLPVVAMIVAVVALIIFWVQYRKRQM